MPRTSNTKCGGGLPPRRPDGAPRLLAALLLAALVSAAPAAAASNPGAGLEELERDLASALASLDRAEVERELAALREAVSRPGSDEPATAARAMLEVAFAERVMGRQSASRSALEEALAIDPACSADPEHFPPSLRRDLERARGRGRTALTIRQARKGAPPSGSSPVDALRSPQADAPRSRGAAREAGVVPVEGLRRDRAGSVSAAAASPGSGHRAAAGEDQVVDASTRRDEGEATAARRGVGVGFLAPSADLLAREGVPILPALLRADSPPLAEPARRAGESLLLDPAARRVPGGRKPGGAAPATEPVAPAEAPVVPAAARSTSAEPAAPDGEVVSPASGEAHYVLSGDWPAWRPVRAFVAGGQTVIEFSRPLAHDESPALVVIDGAPVAAAGGADERIDFRFDGTRLLVDGVLGRAALVHGAGRECRVVELTLRPGAPAEVHTLVAFEGRRP